MHIDPLWIQALAGLAIAALTIFLLVSARRSNEEARRSRALAAVPIIEVQKPEIHIEFHETSKVRWAHTTVTITNGSAAALDVRIEFRGVAIKGRIGEVAGGVNHLAVLAPAQTLTITPRVRGLINEGAMLAGPTQAVNDYLNDLVELHVACTGLLGANVTEIYEWAPNVEPGDRIVPWRIREIHVEGPALEPIHHRFPDEDERWERELLDALNAASKRN